MKFSTYPLWILSGSILATSMPNQFAIAQITPDTTLGNESSRRTPNVNIKGAIADLIEGGAIRDTNLFHSFLEFNIGDRQRVFFANPDSVVNIFTRITGSNPSDILGTLGVDGNANLFLINPNGILFGDNASLDVNGSFLASTAESINFADGIQFSTTDTQTQPLLTVSMPIGLGLGEIPKSIVNRSFAVDSNGEFDVGLQVQPENTLALVGGEVSLEGGILTAEAGRIEIGSVAGGNSVTLIPAEQGWTLSYKDVENFQDINLSNLAFVNTSGDKGGNIQIQGKNVTITGDSVILSNTFGIENGGNIKIFASELVDMSGDATEISTFTENTGNASNITIKTGKLIVRDGAFINTATANDGQTGKLTIEASDSIELIGTTLDGTLPSGLFSEVLEEAKGNSELITISTKQLIIRDGARIGATTKSFGETSIISIDVLESIKLLGGNSLTGIFNQVVQDEARGSGGDISIQTKQLLVQDGAQISSTTFGIGDAGNININVSELVDIIGSTADSVFASGLFVQTEGKGDSGELSIKTNSLVLQEGGQIASSTFDEGLGGNIDINASESIFLSGTSPTATLLSGNSGIFATAEPGAIGDAGNLDLKTGKLVVENGARIGVDNLGLGGGGIANININKLIIRNGGLVGAGSLLGDNPINSKRGAGGILTINATESVEVTGSGFIGNIPVNSSLFTRAEGTGDAGDLNINTPNLTVKDGGDITAQTSGAGNAGNIFLQVSDNITLSGEGSGLFANTTKDSTGEGGSILTQVQTPQTVTVENGATIAVNSKGSEQGGSIELAAENLTLNNGSITAETTSNQGGNITLNIGNILRFENRGAITATAGTAQGAGDGGDVTINSDFILAFPTDSNYKITAEAFEGKGGNIQITTNSFFGSEFVDISASSERGIDGDVSIEVLEVDPARGLTELTTQVVDASQLITRSCLADGKENEFLVTGRGGLPTNPNESLRGEALLSAEWLTLPPDTNSLSQRKQPVKPSPTEEIVEARAWFVGANGNIVLTANPNPTSSLKNSWSSSHDCNSY